MRATLALTNRKMFHNFFKAKNIIVLFLIAMLIWEMLKPIKEFAVLAGENVPIWIFSLFYTSPDQATNVLKTLLILGFVFIVSDVPFYTKMDIYLRQRIHYRGWIASSLWQGLFSAVIYNLYINALIIVCTFPRITLEAKWGKLISTLVYTDSYNRYKGELTYTSKITDDFTPVTAWMHTFILGVLVLFFLYLVMLLLRIVQSKEWLGQVVGTFFVCIDWVICYMKIAGAYWLSPVSLLSIQIYHHGSTDMPDLRQAYLLILLLDVILCSLVFWRGVWENERSINPSSQFIN